jgi:glucose/arabinose dehydrogenase
MKKLSIFLAAVLLFACKKSDHPFSGDDLQNNPSAKGKPDAPGNLHTRIVNSNLNYPWEILWGPDNFIWMTEREGRVSRVNPATGQVIPVATITEVASTTNFNGLLGMVLHPRFSTNPFVYVIYNYFSTTGQYLEKIVRFTYNGGTLVSPMTLVDGIVGKIGGDFIHNGSRLVIGADMKLYATTGDANMRFDFPQNPSSLNGKILRVNLDGSIPADNPFGNAVWAIGQRNPQGLVFGGSKLYSSMHGETTDDEINIILKGRNYGWPFVEGFCDKPQEQSFCAANNVVEPIYAWTPTIAPSGIDYYNNKAIAQWKNSLLVAVLKGKELLQMKLTDDGSAVEEVHEFFKNEFGRLRDVAISPDGKVYICTDNGNHADKIIEIVKGN